MCVDQGESVMFYVMSLKTGTIIDIYDSLLEAKELVSEYPEWTIMIKYDDRRENP